MRVVYFYEGIIREIIDLNISYPVVVTSTGGRGVVSHGNVGLELENEFHELKPRPRFYT